MQKFKTAGYIRLSKEDKIKDESNSVTNQKLIITSFVEKNEDAGQIVRKPHRDRSQSNDSRAKRPARAADSSKE